MTFTRERRASTQRAVTIALSFDIENARLVNFIIYVDRVQRDLSLISFEANPITYCRRSRAVVIAVVARG